MPDPADDYIDEFIERENDILKEYRKGVEDRADAVVQAIETMIDAMAGPMVRMQDIHLSPGAEHREKLKGALMAFIGNGEQ